MANIDPSTLKQQSEMLSQMSDDEIKKKMDSAKSFMPSNYYIHSVFVNIDMPNMTPEMFKMASQQLKNMSPEQIEQMTKMVRLLNIFINI